MNRKDWEIYFDAVRKQNWETARNVLQKISAEEKNNPQVYLKLGDVYQKTGDTAQAIASYHLSARLLRSKGFSQKAVALYKIILRLDPKDSEATAGSKEVVREIEAAKSASFSDQCLPGPVSEAADESAPVEEPADKLPNISPAADLFTSAVPSFPGRQAGAGVPHLFAGMSNEEFLLTLQALQVRIFSAGEKVIEEGDSGDSVYLIASGRVKVVAHLMGKEIELAELGEGDLFGEVAFLTGRPRTAEVLALGPLKVFEIGRLDIERIIERNPEVLSRIEDFYERRAMDTVKKIRSRPKNS